MAKTNKKLPKVYAKYKGICQYCHSPCVMVRSIPTEKVIAIGQWFILYNQDGKRKWAKKATVDHIIQRRDGGNDKMSNLTLACCECNQKKSRQKPKGICRGCGITSEKRFCPTCANERRERYLQSLSLTGEPCDHC